MRPALLPFLLIALAGCTPASAPTSGTDGDAPGPPVAKTPGQSGPTESMQANAASAQPADPTTRIGIARMDGYGALRLGMTFAQAQAAWDDDLRGDAPTAGNCVFLTPQWAEGRGDFGFMFERGRFVRYDVGKPQEIAPGGGHVGMGVAEIEALYPGRIRSAPHDYVPGGRTLRIADEAVAGRALLFETDAQGRVSAWRVGLEPQVDYTEGCS